MLEKLSDEVRACHERAAEATRKAEATSDPGLKADYLAAAHRWTTIARSYEFTDRVTDFTSAMNAKLDPHEAARSTMRKNCNCSRR